jgi:hypothetical protein
MASEKRISANRANAKKSTGPKTPAGKMKSSRNSLRHGHSSQGSFNPETAAKAAVLAQALVAPGEADEATLNAATALAEAHLEIDRIHQTREELMETVDADPLDVRSLKRMASLDRYERYALTRRRKASRQL